MGLQQGPGELFPFTRNFAQARQDLPILLLLKQEQEVGLTAPDPAPQMKRILLQIIAQIIMALTELQEILAFLTPIPG